MCVRVEILIIALVFAMFLTSACHNPIMAPFDRLRSITSELQAAHIIGLPGTGRITYETQCNISMLSG